MRAIGTEVCNNSKKGGGSYLVIGIICCSRCQESLELREQLEPSKAQRKAGHYYAEYAWCHKCGLYQPNKNTRIVIKKWQS